MNVCFKENVLFHEQGILGKKTNNLMGYEQIYTYVVMPLNILFRFIIHTISS